MNREESALIGLEIVSYAGEARSKLLMALEESEQKNFAKAEQLIIEANESINQAHKIQTEMLVSEAQGNSVELGFLMMHGQDHLMTTLLLRDMIKYIMNIHKGV